MRIALGPPPRGASFFRCNDAPLIGERAASRGRSATEGAMSTPVRRAAIRSNSSLAYAGPSPPSQTGTPPRMTRPGTRARSSMTYRPTWDDVHAAALVVGNDTPLIGEQAA